MCENNNDDEHILVSVSFILRALAEVKNCPLLCQQHETGVELKAVA